MDCSSAFNKVIPHQTNLQTEQPGPRQFTVHMDTGHPQQQTTNCQNGRTHIIHSHPEHWHTTGVCPQPPPLLPCETCAVCFCQQNFSLTHFFSVTVTPVKIPEVHVKLLTLANSFCTFDFVIIHLCSTMHGATRAEKIYSCKH